MKYIVDLKYGNYDLFYILYAAVAQKYFRAPDVWSSKVVAYCW